MKKKVGKKMKKQVLASLFVSTMLLSYTGANVLAATSAGDTEADATFTAGERPDPAKPEEGPKEPTPVDPDPDPLPETGNVYVTHLPNITFGSNKTNLKTTEYNALTEKRTQDNGNVTFYMPHSAQVADLSGSNETKWKLSVQQKAVFSTVGETPQKLENTRIRIYGNTLTSSAYAATDLAGKISGVAMDQTDTAFGSHSAIPVATDATTELTVLASSTAGFTGNSYTSSVFANDYLEENFNAEKTPAAEKYEGVRLNVPASDQSQAKAYKANLTWTLTVEP